MAGAEAEGGARGYLRYPSIAGERIVFIAEDDLWTVEASGGTARRLTTALSDVSQPWLSPDGELVAFVAREDGPSEVYVIDAAGGPPRQLTCLGSSTVTSGWGPDGRVVFCSDARAPFGGQREGFLVAPGGGEPERLPWGPAQRLALGPGGRVVVGRNVGDPARWKRYRGGTAGEFWVDAEGSGSFTRWDGPRGNLASPMWIGDRVYFLSDHEGVGNLYSARPDGGDLRRHTDHADYYARNAQTDGRRVVYHAGGDLYVFDPATGASTPLEVQLRSQRTQRSRRFVDAGRFMDGLDIHPRGHALLATTRGRAFAFGHWEGPVLPAGEAQGVRYRLARWLPDGRRMVAVADAGGEEALEVHGLAVPAAGADPEVALAGGPIRRLAAVDIGRAVELAVCPAGDRVALANHRNEVLVVDLGTESARLVERNAFGACGGLAWAPDGRWLCYAAPLSRKTTALRLCFLPDDTQGGADGDAAALGNGAAEANAAGAGTDGAGEDGDTAAPRVGAEPGDSGGAPGPGGAGDDGGRAGEDEAPGAPRPGEPVTITRPVLHDLSPSFDPEGRYLYFLSYRTFNPVYDSVQFDLGFPRGVRPYLIPLRADEPSPFQPRPRPLQGDAGDEDHEKDENNKNGKAGDGGPGDGGNGEDSGGKAGSDGGGETDGGADGARRPAGRRRARPVRIDLDGIQERVCAFPVPEGRYWRIAGVRGKALFASWPVEGSLDEPGAARGRSRDRGVLEAFDLRELRAETIADAVADFWLSPDARTLAYRSGERVRVVVAGKRPERTAADESGRRSGWVDVGRVRVAVEPALEWAQMLREAWRLQRDNFWTADLSGVDWQLVWARYSRLLPRIATRGELSDLMWEMQGELGTSHAYEMGGDYRAGPAYGQGFLGADLAWDEAASGYRIERMLRGDGWADGQGAPLRGPGVRVAEGDVILAVDGRRVSRDTALGSLLVGKGGAEVALTVVAADRGGAGARPEGAGSGGQEAAAPAAGAAPEPAGDPSAAHGEASPGGGGPGSGSGTSAPAPAPRTVVVRALRSERPARYRDWVEANRASVHERSDGRIGYIHIPDMGPRGYAEFHRAWLTEAERDGLIVDVRHNGGGHVSQLILEKLARRPVGWDVPRWMQPEPYPADAVPGPVVALCDELAGSDGDIFSHAFKLMKIGPLVGRRTWGGVIGIWVRHPLVDGTFTSQPEFSFWFPDVGWGVENYGTDPDIAVDNRPEDHRSGDDRQLARALEEALAWLAERPVVRPAFDGRPSRALPALPPRLG